jgi:hypothetical protein
MLAAHASSGGNRSAMTATTSSAATMMKPVMRVLDENPVLQQRVCLTLFVGGQRRVADRPVAAAQVKHQRGEAADEQNARAEPQQQSRSLEWRPITDEVAVAADHEFHDLGVASARP